MIVDCMRFGAESHFLQTIFTKIFTNQSCLYDLENSKVSWTVDKVKPKPQKYYKELTDFELIDSSNM